METQNILALIEEKLPRMSKSHRKIGNYILNHFDKAVFMTAAQLGEELEISESTVVRFAGAIGMDGYPKFQKELEKCVKNRLSGKEEIDDTFYGRSRSEILTSVMKADIEKLKDTIEHLDADAFDQAVETILNADTVYVMGLRSNEPLARFLHFYLNIIRRKVVLLSTTSLSETFEQMMYIGNKDCLIGISFPRYSMRTLKAMELANDRNARVIAITDNVNSPMNLYSSCNLCARSDMISIMDSLVAPLSVINALLVALILKCPGEVRENMEMLENVWGNYQIYLKDEINFVDDEPMLNHSSVRRKEDEPKETADSELQEKGPGDIDINFGNHQS